MNYMCVYIYIYNYIYIHTFIHTCPHAQELGPPMYQHLRSNKANQAGRGQPSHRGDFGWL